MFVEVSPYTRVQNQILTPSNLFLFVYSQLKLSGCLFTFPTVDKNELALLYKTVGLFLSAISKYIYIFWFITIIIKYNIKATKGVRYFLPFMYYTVIFVYAVILSIVFENVFSLYLENDFYGSINFHKKWKQTAM